MASVGRLEPGVTYVYERVDGVTYARKQGDPPNQRFEVGRSYESQKLHDEIKHAKLWGEIHRAAKTNPALQEALDRVIVIYQLIKQDQPIMHHPV